MDVRSWQMLRWLDPEWISKIKIASVFGTSGNAAIIVTKEDEVFSFGVNESGCLGLGETQAFLTPMKIEKLCNKRVKGFTFGSGPFAVALTEDGAVYSWGLNNYGQVGNDSSVENVLTPSLVGGELLGKQVIEVACGGSHTLALTAEGEVYFWGKNYTTNTTQQSNTYNSHAVNNIGYQKAPKKVNFDTELKKVIAVACGNKTSIALLENGELHGWGYDEKGQLGLGTTGCYQPNPVWISSFKQTVIAKVVCGYSHTLAISVNGDLFAWGDNTYGQLGTENAISRNKPVRITLEMGRVVDIAAVHTLNLSAAMTENSEVYMWGLFRGQNITKPLKTHFRSLNDVFACCATGTPTPIRVDMNPRTTVAESMRKAFNDPKHSDLTIMVDGKPIYLHKTFLKIRCEHLETRFSERWEEGNTDVCQMNVFPYEVYQPFLEYLYTDEVNLSGEDAVEVAVGLLDVANSYGEEHLKYKCVEIIKRELNVKNVVFVYDSIIKYHIKELEESCLKLFANHKSDAMETEGFKNLDLKVQLELLKKIVKRL